MSISIGKLKARATFKALALEFNLNALNHCYSLLRSANLTFKNPHCICMPTLPSLQIGQHTARYPIIQGGMGIRISGAQLAAAVANAGGIGIISAVALGLNSTYFDIAVATFVRTLLA